MNFIPLRKLRESRELKTPVLNGLRKQGLVDVFLYFGELTAMNRTGGPIPKDTANYIREHKDALIAEIKALTGTGEKVSFDNLLADRLLPDGTLRPATGWQKSRRSGSA